MALSELSEKLDQLSEQELGFEFDDAAVWSKLEQKLDNKNRYAFWWVAAACLLAGFLFWPLGFFESMDAERPMVADQVEVAEEELVAVQEIPEDEPIVNGSRKEPAFMEFKIPSKKEIAHVQLAEVSRWKLHLKPIPTQTAIQETESPLFAAEDISIIQASLEQSSIEKGRTMTIRAQWQKSPDELNVNYQALKIKLYEKEKKQ